MSHLGLELEILQYFLQPKRTLLGQILKMSQECSRHTKVDDEMDIATREHNGYTRLRKHYSSEKGSFVTTFDCSFGGFLAWLSPFERFSICVVSILIEIILRQCTGMCDTPGYRGRALLDGRLIHSHHHDDSSFFIIHHSSSFNHTTTTTYDRQTGTTYVVLTVPRLCYGERVRGYVRSPSSQISSDARLARSAVLARTL